MKSTLQLKFGLTLLFATAFLTILLIESSKHNTSKTIAGQQEPPFPYEKVKAENPSKNSDLPNAQIFVEPTPFIKQQGKAKGTSSIVKFEKDLETSLKIQEVPYVWFEYKNDNNETVKVEIPAKAREFIKKRWLNTLTYSYQYQTADSREDKLAIDGNNINDTVIFALEIEKFRIKTPLEDRTVSRDEAFEIIHLTAKLAVERYIELKNMASQINPQKITE